MQRKPLSSIEDSGFLRLEIELTFALRRGRHEHQLQIAVLRRNRFAFTPDPPCNLEELYPIVSQVTVFTRQKLPRRIKHRPRQRLVQIIDSNL
jgi:hypothetical protein